MAEKEKQAELERLSKVLGVSVEALPKDIKDFLKANPDQADVLMGQTENERKVFETRSKQVETLLKMEKQKAELFEKSNRTGALYQPDPAVIEQIQNAQNDMTQIMNGTFGVDMAAVERAQGRQPIFLGDENDPENSIQLTEDQFFEMVQDQNKARQFMEDLTEAGKDNLAAEFSKAIGTEVQKIFAGELGNALTPETPLTAPTPETRGPAPEVPPGAGVRTPDENIQENIRTFEGGSAQDQVQRISSALKSVRQTGGV